MLKLMSPRMVIAAAFVAMPLLAGAPEPAAAQCDYLGYCEATVQGGLNDSCGYGGCEGTVDTDTCSYGYCEVEIYDDTGIWGTTTDTLQCEADWLGNIICH